MTPKEEAIEAFRRLLAEGAAIGVTDRLAAEIRQARGNLERLGASDGEINEVIHDRHARANAYQPKASPFQTSRIVPLRIPPHELKEAQASGAQWDAQQRMWVAPPGSDLRKLRRWLPR